MDTQHSGTHYCADIIALYQGKLVLIERLKYPKGYALPGGKREWLENRLEEVEACALREFQEETGLTLIIQGIVGTYDAPGRDPRGYKSTTVVYGIASGRMKDEPGKTRAFLINPADIDMFKDKYAFDHYAILKDWQKMKENQPIQST